MIKVLNRYDVIDIYDHEIYNGNFYFDGLSIKNKKYTPLYRLYDESITCYPYEMQARICIHKIDKDILVVNNNDMYLNLENIKQIYVLKQLIKQITNKDNIYINKIICLDDYMDEMNLFRLNNKIYYEPGQAICNISDIQKITIGFTINSEDLISYKLEVYDLSFM
jgi:hypothetical protein